MGKIYVCYEENSPALHSDAGVINNLFVTADKDLARAWAHLSYSLATRNGYDYVDENEYRRFVYGIGIEDVFMPVYKNEYEDAPENFCICVRSFDTCDDMSRLLQMFDIGG